jgi:hypothetical protein
VKEDAQVGRLRQQRLNVALASLLLDLVQQTVNFKCQMHLPWPRNAVLSYDSSLNYMLAATTTTTDTENKEQLQINR